MFQIDWALEDVWKCEAQALSPGKSQLPKDSVRRTCLLHWEEHCLECAIPACYASCPLYVNRVDGKCARFTYGIYPNPQFSGLFDFGADLRFRPWAKLETQLYGKTVSVRQHRLFDQLNRFVSRPFNGNGLAAESAASVSSLHEGRLAASGKTLLAKARNKCLTEGSSLGIEDYDEFVLECFSPDPGSFRLILEHYAPALKSRHSFEIHPGWNFTRIPVQSLELRGNPDAGKLSLYPEDNAERRLIFTWLDLVRYRTQVGLQPGQDGRHTPADKVKCVAWDLDNTLWEGILAEDSERRLEPRPEALELVRRLDQRGILQTIVSKNNFADAWPVVERLDLQDYFLHPAINWQPKSANLKRLADELNLGIDSFALIDDSPFERAEVQSALPQVRVYSDDQMPSLLGYPEFDVPVSESSQARRASYLTEIKREQEREAFVGNYEAFLRSCRMRMSVFVPRQESQVRRCLELIQRSNQLNLSTNRYTAEEFQHLLANPEMLCLAMQCEDRFGAYGIVGFASVDEGAGTPTLRDLVISCRVAQKRVEHTLLGWLAARERSRRNRALAAVLIKTDRNQPIRQVFADLRFQAVEENGERALMTLPLDEVIAVEDVVALDVEDGLQESARLCQA